MDIVTRAEAKAAGQTTYFTGKPCSKGHVAPRRVENWNCTVCAAAISKKRYDKVSKTEAFTKANRARVRRWAAQNTERARASNKAWREANKDKKAALDKAYRTANAAAIKAKQAKRRRDNPELFKARDKRMRERPGARDKARETTRKWRQENAERHRQTVRKWREKQRAAIASNGLAWRKKNPEKVKAIKAASAHKRRQLIELAGDDVTMEQIMEVLERGKCAACAREDGPMEIDHIKALSRGGAHHVSNLQLLCRPCNRRKWSKDYSTWLTERVAA